jgi:hypothetical protein
LHYICIVKQVKNYILILLLIAMATVIILISTNKNDNPPINYQSQLDSLNGVIALQDKIIDNMVADLDSLIELKSKVQIVQGKKIIVYKSLTTPNKVQQFAERL